MDSRRRTLASEGPLGNALPSTSIPVPSSAMKKPAMSRLGNSRMSLAPSSSIGGPASRMSSVSGATIGVSHSSSDGPGAGPGASAGAGGMRRSTIQPGRNEGVMMSASRGDGGIYGRTPQTTRSIPGSVRRNSVYTSGRPSLAPVMHSSGVRDNRPIRSEAFRVASAKNIEGFLRLNRCSIAITSKFWTGGAATRDVHDILKWLINEFIDPGFQWGKKFEDDCVQILKDLRYPAVDTISKTSLTTAGSGANWPNLLAMMNWLVELCKALEQWKDPELSTDPVMFSAKELDINNPAFEDRLMWDFASATYTLWYYDGIESYPEEIQELEEAYDRLAQESFDASENLETEVQKRTLELKQLQAQEPPLKKLEEEYMQLMGDKTKFIAFLELHKNKADKIRQGIDKAKALMADQENQIAAARAELVEIETAVAAQNLSPDEVQRMNHERETLSRNLDDLRGKIAEARQFAYDQEMLVTKSMDRFEQLLADYTALGHQIGVIRPLSEGPTLGPGDVDYSVDVDLGLEDLHEVQGQGKNMRQVIWPALQAYGETFRKQMVEMENGNIALDDENDRLGQKVERQKEEAANLEMRLRVVREQAEEAKHRLDAETAETNETVTKLETEVRAMSNQSQQSVLKTQSELESTKIAFKELRHKTALLQDSVLKQLTSHIDVIIKAKEHTANSLRGVRSFAEAR
ncbi:kinetochore-associated Ndc80 complex subunit ndc80 [Saitozyma podzolica]|uniref:Kinetochore protein NDC80 n=1 Tax=Saitozyma podzolica TaxID=1890683 RepID=A0A427YGF8_9TREE|nr:kinetochore-associated Ndc80 complex subunit ndc80 [Saitozyma podzolica]